MPSQQHLNVHITVATVVENQGRFLMVREERDPSLILMNQPAGHLEANETLVEAALRETLEETAWQVDITDYLGVLYLPLQRWRHVLSPYLYCQTRCAS